MAYAATPINSVSLERVGKLATAVVALLGVTSVLAVIAVWTSQAAQSDAEALLDGTIDAETFVERAAPFLLMTAVQGVVTIATAVVTIVWMYRVAKNLRSLHRGTTWGPGWAIGGWFLPPLLFVIPTLALRELWKASDAGVPVGGDWRSNRTSPLVWLWFVVYSLVPLVLLAIQSSQQFALGASEEDLAEQVVDGRVTTIVSSAVTIAGAVVFALLVRRLTDRHRRLTGEAAA